MEIKNILFDFDGVILDSNSIKDDAYRFIFKDYKKIQVDIFIKYHQENGAISRYQKIKYFFETILNQECNQKLFKEILLAFSEFTLEKLSNKGLLIKKTVDFIKQNKHYNYHIVSGTSEDDLMYICKQLEINELFITIEGSPEQKDKLVNNILDKFNYDRSQTILIGDSINDYNSAIINDIRFYGYNNMSLKNISSTYIESFDVIT